MVEVSRLIPGIPFIVAGVLCYFDAAGALAGRLAPEPRRSRIRVVLQLVMYIGVILAGRLLLEGLEGVIDPFTIGISGTLAFYIAGERSSHLMSDARERGTWTKELETRRALVLLAAYGIFLAAVIGGFWNR